jgi:hypothetical protein
MTKGPAGPPSSKKTTLGLRGPSCYFLVVFFAAAVFLAGAAFFIAPAFS